LQRRRLLHHRQQQLTWTSSMNALLSLFLFGTCSHDFLDVEAKRSLRPAARRAKGYVVFLPNHRFYTCCFNPITTLLSLLVSANPVAVNHLGETVFFFHTASKCKPHLKKITSQRRHIKQQHQHHNPMMSKRIFHLLLRLLMLSSKILSANQMLLFWYSHF
jgi:hypothetical protein